MKHRNLTIAIIFTMASLALTYWLKQGRAPKVSERPWTVSEKKENKVVTSLATPDQIAALDPKSTIDRGPATAGEKTTLPAWQQYFTKSVLRFQKSSTQAYIRPGAETDLQGQKAQLMVVVLKTADKNIYSYKAVVDKKTGRMLTSFAHSQFEKNESKKLIR